MAPQAPVADKKDPEAEKKRKIMRMGGDKIWKDDSLADWPDDDYRLFCGNLGNEVDDSTLARTFNKYASFQKAKVIRDQRTKKSKGYGFVSLGDPADFTRAIRELNGKYVGNRPIKLSKSEWQDRQLVANIKKRPKMNPSSAKKHI
jgi:RNA recognition motif-containing protein